MKWFRKYGAMLLIILGVTGLITSYALYLNQPRLPHGSPTSITVAAAPSVVKPTAQTVAAYSVPPTHPKYIAIPALGITNTPIFKLGLLQSGAIATPDNIYDTGWYDGSSLPGATGAMFMYGHVSSWRAEGIFYNLKKLKPGQLITITTGDNTTYTYKMVSAQVYSYNNVAMNQVLAPINPNVPGLNLMTCTGSVIKGTSEFTQRLVVFASLTAT
jgi:sortase (surface protein transpeptidase)